MRCERTVEAIAAGTLAMIDITAFRFNNMNTLTP